MSHAGEYRRYTSRLSRAVLLLIFVSMFGSRSFAQPASRPTTRSFPLTVVFLANWPDERFNSDRVHGIADNLLTWQNTNGGWWKGYDPAARRPLPADPNLPPTTQSIAAERRRLHQDSTIDNGATHSEIRILARANQLWPDPRYREAIERGVHFLLDMQYPNGGWPQQKPIGDGYATHITFNDDAMASVLRLLRDVADGKPEFSFIDQPTRDRARTAYERGLECVLACQIRVNGKLTAWCAQHDEVTLEPTSARTYELASISGMESAGVTLMLMEIPNPDERIKQAVCGAYEWFEQAKLVGVRMAYVRDPEVPGGRDRRIVEDPDAPAQWARFYDIETNRPFYCGRDGVKKWSLAEVEHERRNNYQWMRPWGQPVLDAYPAWAAKHGLPTTLPVAAN